MKFGPLTNKPFASGFSAEVEHPIPIIDTCNTRVTLQRSAVAASYQKAKLEKIQKIATADQNGIQIKEYSLTVNLKAENIGYR